MNDSNEGGPAEGQEASAPAGETQERGHSGEGAASALAQLKTQAEEHRRRTGEAEP